MLPIWTLTIPSLLNTSLSQGLESHNPSQPDDDTVLASKGPEAAKRPKRRTDGAKIASPVSVISRRNAVIYLTSSSGFPTTGPVSALQPSNSGSMQLPST